jgi:hypothetical protein
MADEQKATRGSKNRDDLQGGTGHAKVIPAVGDDLAAGGTPDTAAAGGGVHPPRPSQSGPPIVGQDVAVKEPKEHTPNEEGPGAKKV